MSSLWIGAPLLLASASPTRRALLEAVAIPVEQEAPEVDERAIEAACNGLATVELASRLAAEKAMRNAADALAESAGACAALFGESK